MTENEGHRDAIDDDLDAPRALTAVSVAALPNARAIAGSSVRASTAEARF